MDEQDPKVLGELNAYRRLANEYFVGVAFALLAAFLLLNALGQIDPRVARIITPTFRVQAPTHKGTENRSLICRLLNRHFLMQALSVFIYAMIISFILVDGLLLDTNSGTSCEFAEREFANSGYDCFLIRRDISGSLIAFDFNCTAAPTANGFFCYREIDFEETDFYLFANTVGISAALFPPLVFATELMTLAFLWVVDFVACVDREDKASSTRRRVFVWAILFVSVLAGVGTGVIFLLFTSVIVRETLILVVAFVFQGGCNSLVKIIDDYYEKQAVTKDALEP